jgi:hypothetical protein
MMHALNTSETSQKTLLYVINSLRLNITGKNTIFLVDNMKKRVFFYMEMLIIVMAVTPCNTTSFLVIQQFLLYSKYNNLSLIMQYE